MIARRILTLACMAISSTIGFAQEPTPPGLPQPESQTQSESQTSPAEADQASADLVPLANAEDPPTADEVAARAAKLKDLLSLVQDNTKNVHKRENPAYFMLMRQIQATTPEQLRSQVTLNPRFNDLYKKPSEYRGQLVNVKLNARRVLPADYKNVSGISRLYEIWGWTEEAKAWMYCCVVPELPPGFPEEGDISEEIELTGYFFKMQAYQPGVAAPNARDLVAPLIIGRIVRAQPIVAKTNNASANWPLILIIGFGSIVMFRLMMHLRGLGRTPPIRRNYRRRSLEPIDPDLVDEALDVPNRGIRIRNANEV